MKKITIYAICLFLSMIMIFSPFRTAAEPVSRSGILVASFYPIYILSLNQGSPIMRSALLRKNWLN